jgi:conjugal transfer/entry exclusion protein
MNRYNDSLDHIDLSENSQIVVNVLQSVPRLNKSYNDWRIVITIHKNIVFNLGH